MTKKKVAKIDNPEWKKYYKIILWWMNEKFYEKNVLSGYAYPAIRESINGEDEYYAFYIEIGSVIHEKGHDEWIKDMNSINPEYPDIGNLFSDVFCHQKEVTLDDLQELNLKLKEAGAEKVFIQTDEMYVHGQAALYNYVKPNTLLLLIK